MTYQEALIEAEVAADTTGCPAVVIRKQDGSCRVAFTNSLGTYLTLKGEKTVKRVFPRA